MPKHGKEKGRPRNDRRKRNAAPDKAPGWSLAWLAALAIVTLAVYGRAVHNGLLNWDDNYYITESPYLKDLSWAGIKAMFGAFLMGNYHPLTLLSYALEHRLAGGIDPALMHGTNVLLHVLNTLLTFLLAQRLLGDRLGAALTAALFALHPLHVESVAWIAERKDVLYTFFFLLALLAWLRHVRAGGLRAYTLALASALLAMLSKSAAVVIGPVLLVLDLWARRPWGWRLVWEKLPFLALGLVFGLVALRSQETAMQESFAPHFPWWQRPFVAGHALFFYLTRFVAPIGQSAMHPYPLSPGDPIAPLVLTSCGALAVLAGLGFIAVRSPIHRRTVLCGTAFFLVTLVMVLQLIPVGRAIVAERYTYVPYIGLSLIVACAVVHPFRARGKVLPLVAAAGVLVVFAVLTVRRIGVWKDSFTLFADVLERYPTDGLMYYNRGLTHYYQGDHAAAVRDYGLAIRHKPDCAMCHYNRALALKELGRMDEVARDLEKTIELQPDHPGALSNRGITRAMKQDLSGALADFDRALAIAPNDTNALINRGITRQLVADIDGACADWRRLAQLGSKRGAALVRQHCAGR